MLGINNDLPLIIIIISSLVCVNDFLVKHVFFGSECESITGYALLYL